jgi:O-antigen/teichoic acid export membrane protein
METQQPSFFRSLIKGTALYSISPLVQRLVTILFLMPINTRYLSLSDYGVMELIEQISVVVAVLVGANISSSLGYFYFETDSPAARQTAVSTTIIGSVLIGTFAALTGSLLADPLSRLVFAQPGYGHYLIIAFVSFPLGFALEAEMSWLRVADRPGMFAVASLARVAVAAVGVVILVAGLKLRVMGVLSSSVAAVVCVGIATTIYCYREIPFSFDIRLFLRMFRFTIPLGLGMLAMFVIHFGDRFVLPHYRPIAELGIYSIAYKMGMLLSLVHGSFATYWSAQVYQVVRRDDGEDIVARIFTYVVLALSLTALTLIFFARPALHFLTTPTFEGAAVLVPVIVGAYYLRAVGDFFRSFFLSEGRPGLDAVCTWIGAAVCIAAYFGLIPTFGIWGAAIATAITFLAMAVTAIVWTYRLRKYRVETSRLIKVALVTTGLVALFLVIPVHNVIVQLLWGTLLLLALPATLLLIGFQKEGEITQVLTLAGALLQQSQVTIFGRFRAASATPGEPDNGPQQQ